MYCAECLADLVSLRRLVSSIARIIYGFASDSDFRLMSCIKGYQFRGKALTFIFSPPHKNSDKSMLPHIYECDRFRVIQTCIIMITINILLYHYFLSSSDLSIMFTLNWLIYLYVNLTMFSFISTLISSDYDDELWTSFQNIGANWLGITKPLNEFIINNHNFSCLTTEGF